MMLVGILQQFTFGVLDSLNVLGVSHVFYCSPTLRRRFFQCFVLNGLIFLGSLLLSERIVFAALDAFLKSRTDPSHSELLRAIFTVIYNTLWTYPLYTISFLLNTAWYSEMAVHAFRVQNGTLSNNSSNPSGSSSFSYRALITFLSEEVLRYLTALTFFVQITAAFLVPHVGEIVSLLLLAAFYAYYCFEYKWTQLPDWPLQKRMAFFEQHFTYFLGFGMPATVATYFFPYFINAGMFAFLFPLLIVAAVVADRETQLERIAASTHVVSLPAFYLPWKLNAFLLRLLRIKRKLNQSARNTATVSGSAGNVSRPAKTVPFSKHQ